jgi:hypothetical protein
MPPNAIPFDDSTRRMLGEGVLAYFAKLYPRTEPVPVLKVLDIVQAVGSQRAAAKLIGVTDRTLRRWANGAVPTKANLAKVDRAYRTKDVRDSVFVNHLKDRGFTPRTTIERILFNAIEQHRTTGADLGAVLAKFMVDHGVPQDFVALSRPTFTPGMDQMYFRLCQISEDDDRGAWPFNIGKYA